MMFKITIALASILAATDGLANGDAGSTDSVSKFTVLIRGVHCDKCVDQLRTALKKVKGVNFDPDDIDPGEKPRYFTEPFVVEVKDKDGILLGKMAKAVSDTQTPHDDDVPPSLNLVLFTLNDISEQSVSDLRFELRKVEGLEVDAPGSLGGFLNERFFWVRVEEAAELKPILNAAKEVDDGIQLLKPDEF